MKAINAIRMGGVEVLPLVEGGKGVSVSNGASCGAWASAGGVGTFSAVNADSYDADGRRHPRRSTTAGPGASGTRSWSPTASPAASPRRAKRMSARGGQGRIHANILWEMGGAERVIRGVLEGAKGLINGITCGAGMPYRLADIAREFGVYYYPIVSSARAFSALWKRAYSKARDWLGGVVYEDPWLAGGHNGLSNSEDPLEPEDPFPRVLEAAPADARVRPGRHADHHGRRRLVAGGMGGLDRQPRARPDRLPVRHPPAADAGKPDLGRLEAAAADAQARRRAAAALLADRLLLLAPCATTSCASWRTATSARSPTPPSRSATTSPNTRVGPRKRRVWLTAHDRARVRPVRGRGLHRGDAHAGQHADLRDAREAAREIVQGPDRLHGLPLGLPLLQLVAARAGLQHRQEGRSAQLLHPEDAAGHRARRRAGAAT